MSKEYHDCRVWTVADLIVSHLQKASVRAIFGVPGGGGNLDLIAAAGRADLPFVLTATETAGAIAAMAQAEVTGAPGACLTTLGPGVTSVVNGVACAFLDRAPLLVFTDSHSSAQDGFSHQRVDHEALLAPVTKSTQLLTPDNAARAVQAALDRATDDRPGPVHLDCPGDTLGTVAPTGLRSADWLRTSGRSALRTDAGADSRLAGLLRVARKPLLLIGLGARRPDDAAAIRRLCQRRHVPAMVTYKAKGVVPDDHAWFGGVITNGALERPLIEESDLLIGVGLDPIELIPRAWTYTQPVIYCGPWRIDSPQVPFAVQVITDVAAAVAQVDALLPVSTWEPVEVQRLVSAQRDAVRVRASGLSAQRVVEIAAERLSHSCRVTVDAGAHMFPATVLWPVHEPNGMLISNGLSTMGFALPAAIGAALVDRDRPVVVLTGDGGLLMCAGELLTAVRERLRIIAIVFSDASLSLIEIKQQARQLKPTGVALGDVDWPALAGSFGVTGLRATTEAELKQAIDRALAYSGPSLIEARIDRSNYGTTLRAVRG